MSEGTVGVRGYTSYATFRDGDREFNVGCTGCRWALGMSTGYNPGDELLLCPQCEADGIREYIENPPWNAGCLGFFVEELNNGLLWIGRRLLSLFKRA